MHEPQVQPRLRSRSRWVPALGVIGLLFVVLWLLGQCYSATLPPALEPSQRALVESAHFPFRVAVAPHRFPVYAERLTEALRRTALFDEVAPLGEVREPHLIARVEREVYGSTVIPLFTALTLGFYPTTADEEWGEVFSLQAPRGMETVDVDFAYTGPTTLGWYAAILNVSSDRAAGEVGKSDRFREALSHAICLRAARIRALVDEKR